jgi:hypothetical protein
MWDAIPADDHDKVRAEAGEHLDRARDADGMIRLGQRVRYTLASRGGVTGG